MRSYCSQSHWQTASHREDHNLPRSGESHLALSQLTVFTMQHPCKTRGLDHDTLPQHRRGVCSARTEEAGDIAIQLYRSHQQTPEICKSQKSIATRQLPPLPAHTIQIMGSRTDCTPTCPSPDLYRCSVDTDVRSDDVHGRRRAQRDLRHRSREVLMVIPVFCETTAIPGLPIRAHEPTT